MSKICTKCLIEKDEEDFSWKRKNIQRQPKCKLCFVFIQGEWYRNNRQRHINLVSKVRKLRVIDVKQRLVEFLKANPCVDCCQTDIRTLDFDHKNNKTYNISYMIHNFSWDKILKEIAKCEVRCANCHRIKTCTEQNWYKNL